MSDTPTASESTSPEMGTFDDEGNYTPREVVSDDLGMSFADAIERDGVLESALSKTSMRTSWAVVFPSPKEGWGITNVEAAACGTPISKPYSNFVP